MDAASIVFYAGTATVLIFLFFSWLLFGRDKSDDSEKPSVKIPEDDQWMDY